MPGSGISKLVLGKRDASPKDYKGDYNKRVASMVNKAVHNQPGTKKGKK